MLGTFLGGSDIRNVDIGGGHVGQLFLCCLSGVLQTLHSHLIAGQIHTLGALELIHQMVDDSLVKVIAAQVVVAAGGQNFDNAFTDVDNGNIEGTAAQVVYHDGLLRLVVQTIGQRSRGGLVDDTLDIQTRDTAGVLGGLTLSVIEVSGNGDNSIGDGFSQISFSISLQLLKNHGADFLRRIGFSIDGNTMIGTHGTFDGTNGFVGIGNSLTFGQVAYQTLTGFAEGYDGRSGTAAFRVGDDYRLSAFHDGHAGVGSTKINTNNFAHL